MAISISAMRDSQMAQHTTMLLQEGKSALLIAPYYDVVTSISSITERSLIDYLESMGMSVITMEGYECTYPNLKRLLEPGLIDLVVYTGHGVSDAWIGQQPAERLLLTANDANLLHDTIVVAIACNSLRILGNKAVSTKARAYLGFLDLVILPVTDYGMADRNYHADFIRTFMNPVVTLVSGKTVHDSVLEFQDLCNYYANKYAEEEYILWEFHQFAMLHNATNFSYAGRPDEVL